MITVFDTYTKAGSGYTITGRYPTLPEARAALNLPDEAQWQGGVGGDWIPQRGGPDVFISPTPAAESDADRITLAVELAFEYGDFDDRHKAWVIDQMLRVLLGDGYAARVEVECSDEDGGPDTFVWNTGVAP
jgi:hypothetical protein